MTEEATSNTITEVTRRAIVDYLIVSCHWSGAVNDVEFLSRLYNLKEMPSTDYRRDYPTARADIWQHRVRNPDDWPDDWAFTDERFNLLHGPVEPFLKFLCETVHPLVRPDTGKAQAMVTGLNSHLTIDGRELYPAREISNKPVFDYRTKVPRREFVYVAHEQRLFILRDVRV
jgi:hypothetical protein